MEEKSYKINNVVVDLSYYTGNDSYSDGDIEAEILEALKNGKEKEMLLNDNRWPVVYHLTPMRQNLLDGFNFVENANVLEIGCGCGAITGILCYKASKVTAVEISPRRAEIAAYRNKDMNNLRVCVGNLNDMKFTEKFDYVTLIGVLEYAGSFTHTDEPWKDFLLSCKRFLKPNGKIIIAIENKLGMKYWSGAREDHTGGYFDGMEGYTTDSVRTFSRKELNDLLISVGLSEVEWFYPYPDYKLPIDIYSDRHWPTRSQLKEIPNWAYDHNRIELFSENKGLFTMLDAGLYSEFANSFLVFAGGADENNLKQPIYIHHPFMRKDEYSVVTSIIEQESKKVIRKIAINECAKKHLKIIEENCQILSGIYGKEHVAQCKFLTDSILEMEYVEGDNFSDLAIQAMYENGVEGLSEYIKFYCNNLLKGVSDNSQNMKIDFCSFKRQYNFDLHFGNIIIKDGNYVIYDYEWLGEKVPSKYILYRALKILYSDNQESMNKFNIDLSLLLEASGIIKADVNKYRQFDLKFGAMVIDSYMMHYRKKIIEINLNEFNIR